jgi:hypothetical protein
MVETGKQAILKEDHPDLLPVNVKHSGIESYKLQIRFKGTELLLDTSVIHTHVIVCEIR